MTQKYLTTLILTCSDFGKNPVVVSFIGNHVGVRRVDGSLVNSAVPLTVITLHEFASSSRWEEARKLCRVAKESDIKIYLYNLMQREILN